MVSKRSFKTRKELAEVPATSNLCNNKFCRKTKSLFFNTNFYNTRLDLHKIFLILNSFF